MREPNEIIVTDEQADNKNAAAFVFFLVFIVLVICSLTWLYYQPTSDGALKPLRNVLSLNERIFSSLLSNGHRAKTFQPSAASPRVRVNGDDGMGEGFNPDEWKLHLVRKDGDTLDISLDDIKKLPKTELIFDFKCIEGWSQVTHWAGVKFMDFANAYGLDTQTKMPYTGMQTPDNQYYVGIDNKSMMHPQTILCYEMNGQPLPLNQGAPLRLIIPVKYGVKNIKRIGTIFFSNDPPPDYWYERGYDYFCGL